MLQPKQKQKFIKSAGSILGESLYIMYSAAWFNKFVEQMFGYINRLTFYVRENS